MATHMLSVTEPPGDSQSNRVPQDRLQDWSRQQLVDQIIEEIQKYGKQTSFHQRILASISSPIPWSVLNRS